MSDSEGDFSDELLELAGASEKKRRKRQAQSKSKRRKAEVSDTEEEQPESEEDDAPANPYPLEGKYTDEFDRQRLLGLSEIEREDILAERQDTLQRMHVKSQLDQMVRDQSGKKGESAHAPRGATKEKSRKLDELKAKRKAKGEKKKRSDSPKRDRSSSPMDMETDEDEEDGQISKLEEQEERDRRLYGEKAPSEDEPATLEDLSKIRLTRDMVAKFCTRSWFEEFMSGAWVRYLIGNDEHKNPIYRVCEITDILQGLNPAPKPYPINDQTVNQEITLKHGSAARNWNMDKISNSSFTEREFDRLVKVCQQDGVKLPTKRQIEKKAAVLNKLASQPITETEIAAMIARKRQLSADKQSMANLTIDRSRLNQALLLAQRRQDETEAAELREQLVTIEAEINAREAQAGHREETLADRISKVNDRNRKANAESIRAAEQAEADRRRKEKHANANANGTATPTISYDPSARLKTVPKMFNPRSTPGTPQPGLKPDSGTPRGASPMLSGSSPLKGPSSGKQANSIFDTVEVDLGDF
ncbi:hypothetical protein EUX98_g5546 [Antrodiella citrinella]|uniref:Plus3 domain-containing protein n=1 Tax=Antrodiella citrinella TaxID=2447956 RepID=A0A4S4MU19_9APHY|nr:hypothetical protein EUX98_g5546 [Antrodiella citrinella]